MFTFKKIYLSALFALPFLFASCTKEPDVNASPAAPLTKSIVPDTFDWETVDWMPTPAGQPNIPVPWVGQGSITAFYGLDIVNDYKKVDGWKMLYSTFRDSGEELVNPYFVLYNVYRGTLRIYQYVTSSFVATSSYLQDRISLVAADGIQSNILNFLGNNVIDSRSRTYNYCQMQPYTLDGSAPLASNRWYMIEYELAYDPGIIKLPARHIQLKWQLDYVNALDIEVEGDAQTTINGTFGASSASNFNFLSTLKGGASTAGKGAFAMFGLDQLNSLKVDDNGANNLGVSANVFKALLSGATSAVSSISAGLPEFAFELLNVVFGGRTGSSATPVSLKAESEISLRGDASGSGSFPSMPISWWIPGTIMSSTIQGYVPLYNEPLGVFYWDGPDTIDFVIRNVVRYEEDDIMFSGKYRVCETNTVVVPRDYASGLRINPAVLEVADVDVVSQDYVALKENGTVYEYNPRSFNETDSSNPYETSFALPDLHYVLKFVIRVAPKDGSPETYICKTFKLRKNIVSNTTTFVD